MRRLFVALLSVLIVFSGFAQDAGEWYQGKPIKDIVFNGLRHVNASELEGIMAPFIGRPFDDDVFWEIQGRLYALEYFDVINPSAVPATALGNEVIIRFNVTERPIVSRITFVGNSHIRRNELLDVVSIKVNDVANQVKLRVDEQAIIGKYLEKGYPDITVRSESRAGSDASITVTFFISEGEKISIKEFRFEGNTTFSDRTLRGQLSLKAKNLVNDGAFQEAKLAADRESLIQYYHDRGYIDAELTDVVREITRDEKGNNNMSITFKIYEGRIYNFGGVTFNGNEIFSTEQLEKLIYSKKGTTVSARKVEADLQRVADLYYENGYIFNSFSREENEEDKKNGIITYNMGIVERGRAHIEHIIIRGNEKTKTDVILREIPLEPGDVFSKTKVYDAMRNLYNLQYFSMVAPDTPPGSEDSLMDLVFNMEEQPTTDIQFGLTFSGTADPDAFPVSGMFKWTDRNLRGTGNALGAEVNGSPDTQSVSLTYNHRWIFGLPLSGGIDFTFQHTQRLAAQNWEHRWFNGDETYAYPDSFNSYKEYEEASKLPPNRYLMQYDQFYWSLGFSTGYRWATFLGNLSVGGGIRTGLILNTYDADLYRPFDPTLRADNNRPTPANSLWTSVALDQRDLSYDPSRGYYGVQRFGLYGILPMEHEKYIRSDTKLEYFYPIINIPVTETYSFKTIFGIHSGLSFIFKQPGQEQVHASETSKLAVDGMFTGRGWTGEYRNKGLTLWENWAELRIPLVPGIFAWDFFFDAAGVESTQGEYFAAFGIDNMRFSFGGGIRFTIPQFPLRFSFAKRFQTVDGQVQWKKGAVFSDDNPNSGVDFVLSFAMTSY
ncbi:outer membrane protein assembly factor BamA [Spirochaetia bacterium]|nr:outer membrane protein assembly factor BamA [Spirochaetia bacterium]